MIPKIKTIVAKDDLQIEVTFEDGVQWIIDCKPKDNTSIYTLFEDRDFFMQAHIQWNAIIRDDRVDMCWDSAYIKITWKNPFV